MNIHALGAPVAHALLLDLHTERLLFDCGPGTIRAIDASEVPIQDIDCVLFTGLMANHISEFGPFMLAGWRSGRREPVTVYGPSGVEDMAEATRTLYAADIQHGLAVERLDSNGIRFDVHEIHSPHVFATPAVRVTAHLDRSEGVVVYRVSTANRSLIIGSSHTLVRDAQTHLEFADEVILLDVGT